MCLGRDEETDLRPYLRQYPEQLYDVVRSAMYHKPEKHAFEQAYRAARAMNQIGG